MKIKDETDAAIVLITHDLGVVAGMVDRMLVMYAGTVVESGTVDDVFYRAPHAVHGRAARLDPVARQPRAAAHARSPARRRR